MTQDPVAIQIAKIESKLKELRRMAVIDGKNRACLFNLIIYSDEPRYTNYFQELLAQIVEKFPCRIFFIIAEKNGAQDSLTAEVSVTSPGNFLCDKITLKASGHKIGCIPYLILPHLVTDLPIYLIWGQNPSRENIILPYFQSFATSLIFDSECTNNLKQFSEAIMERSKLPHVNLVDMNWVRLRGWREALAKTFDTPNKLKLLRGSKMIQISYNNRADEFFSHPRIQPIYLQAWLASQLKWEFTSITKVGDITRVGYKNSHHQPMAIDLCPKNIPEFPAGVILAVEVMCEEQSIFTVSRKDSSPYVTVTISSKETCEIPLKILLPNQEKQPSFVRDLLYATKGDHYLKMLRTLAHQEYQI
jgi:glucose-6-phosphate dehydrogenase assembly protein OpcA